MVGGVLADEVDDRHLGSAGIVEIGQAIAKAGAEMEEGRRRFPGHPRVTVGRSGDDALEKTQYAPHFRDPVKRGDQMYFGCARVREAGVNATREQRANQIFGPIHRSTALS